jgi:hypothetical protein
MATFLDFIISLPFCVKIYPSAKGFTGEDFLIIQEFAGITSFNENICLPSSINLGFCTPSRHSPMGLKAKLTTKNQAVPHASPYRPARRFRTFSRHLA